MSYADASGNTLNETELRALLTEETQETVYEVEQDIYQRFAFDGTSTEGGQKLLFHSGQRVKESDVDALFVAATVTTISPNTGAAAGGTVVTITGTNLFGVEGVTFGGVAGTALQILSNTQLKVTTPAHAAGAVAVVTKDDAGDVTTAGGYTYV